jgi:hypothetical protein
MLKVSTTQFILVCVAVASVLMMRCNVINPKETVPTYVHVDSFKVNGGITHNITAVWAYYNNSPIGVFDLPATIPVPATATGMLQLSPGIPVDGQNSLMANYPFYTIDTFTFSPQPGKIITHQPQTGFFGSVKMLDIANFDFGTPDFGLIAGNKPMGVISKDSLVVQGLYTGIQVNYSGVINLSAPGDSSLDSSKVIFTIPAGVSAFVEFDYYATVPFSVGLSADLAGLISTGPFFLAGVAPSNGWKKFYMNAQAFATQYQGDSYHFVIKTVLPEGQASGRVLIDNIKLITF